MSGENRFSALILLLPTGLKGRRGPASAIGYQPLFKIGEEYTSVKLFAKDPSLASFEPGNAYKVIIEFIFYEHYRDRINFEKQFLLTEGSRIIGIGVFAFQ